MSYLHPTMYLLIPECLTYRHRSRTEFTSHYVSINSLSIQAALRLLLHLHPTMYLLILLLRSCRPPERNNLHPTMYLLIPVIIKASLFLNSEALFCLPFKSANRLLILYALNMPEA